MDSEAATENEWSESESVLSEHDVREARVHYNTAGYAMPMAPAQSAWTAQKARRSASSILRASSTLMVVV